MPSGASTGTYEAHELRDGDPGWFDGLGVTRAVSHVNGEIAGALRGHDALDQVGADARLRGLDGAPTCPGSAPTPCSERPSRCAARLPAPPRQPLYRRIAELAGVVQPLLPMPMVNILSGGLHAAGHGRPGFPGRAHRGRLPAGGRSPGREGPSTPPRAWPPSAACRSCWPTRAASVPDSRPAGGPGVPGHGDRAAGLRPGATSPSQSTSPRRNWPTPRAAATSCAVRAAIGRQPK